MTLREYIEQNADKEIEIREDGTVWIVEPEGPWKPETGEMLIIPNNLWWFIATPMPVNGGFGHWMSL